MGEYDRTGNGQSSKTDWDLRSILCDIAKNWWVILLIACSAAMITYTVMATVHKDRYTVKTTFAVMGRGVDANAASSLSATYEMAQKFEAILENTILKKKVMEELSLSSFPAKMNASIVPESNLMELSVTADSPEMAFRILKSVLNNYTSISDYIIPNVVLETLQQPQVSGVPSNQIPTKKYAATAFLAAALAMAALIGLFSFHPQNRCGPAGRCVSRKEEEKQLHADYQSGAELSVCGILKAYCIACAGASGPKRRKSAAGDQCGGK